jgi:hypothetical protein
VPHQHESAGAALEPDEPGDRHFLLLFLDDVPAVVPNPAEVYLPGRICNTFQIRR